MKTYVKCTQLLHTCHLTKGKVYERIAWGKGEVTINNDVDNRCTYNDIHFGDPFSDVDDGVRKANLIPRKWAKEIHAWANGEVIQYKHYTNEQWTDCHQNQPSWVEDCTYRVKPKRDPELDKLNDHIAVVQRDRNETYNRIAADKVAMQACDETLARLRNEYSNILSHQKES